MCPGVENVPWCRDHFFVVAIIASGHQCSLKLRKQPGSYYEFNFTCCLGEPVLGEKDIYGPGSVLQDVNMKVR